MKELEEILSEGHLALIQAFKKQIDLRKKKEEILKEKILRNKMLEATLRKKEMELKNLKAKLQEKRQNTD